MVTAPAVGYLFADVIAETGVAESYLAHLVRVEIVTPSKARNGRTNIFSAADLERIRWAMDFRGRLTVAEMRAGAATVRDGG